MFKERLLDDPKDHEVPARWISYVGNGRKDDLILGFFAGSGVNGSSGSRSEQAGWWQPQVHSGSAS